MTNGCHNEYDDDLDDTETMEYDMTADYNLDHDIIDACFQNLLLTSLELAQVQPTSEIFYIYKELYDILFDTNDSFGNQRHFLVFLARNKCLFSLSRAKEERFTSLSCRRSLFPPNKKCQLDS